MKRFLIVKPSSLGDIIHAFPAVSMLAAKYPDAQIDWLAVPAFAPVVKYHPAVDHVILFHRKEMGRVSKFPGAFLSLFSDIRKNRYDAVIDLQGLLRSALIARMAKAKTVAGPAETREALSKVFYKYKMDSGDSCRHAVCKNMSMMAEFLNEPLPERVVFEMPENAAAAKKATALLCSFAKEKLIALAPGARSEAPGLVFRHSRLAERKTAGRNPETNAENSGAEPDRTDWNSGTGGMHPQVASSSLQRQRSHAYCRRSGNAGNRHVRSDRSGPDRPLLRSGGSADSLAGLLPLFQTDLRLLPLS